MKPTNKFAYSIEPNCTYTGTGKTLPLPVVTDGYNNVSCWRASLKERLYILLTGKVYLNVKGQTHPPVWVGIANEIFIKEEDNNA